MISYLGEKKFQMGKKTNLDFSINPNFKKQLRLKIQINSAYDLIIITIIISILVVYFSYRYSLSSSENSVLIFFRVLISALLILLIFNPVIEKKGSNKISLLWHIYIDESLSMKYHKQPSELAYKQGIQNFIEKIKEKI